MKKITLDSKRCKGCFMCISVCPTKALSLSGEIGEKSYETVKCDESKCVACGSCYRICPDYVFTVSA